MNKIKPFVEVKRDSIRELLNQCTESQISLFNLMYGSIDAIKEEKMDWAYSQCKKTVEENNNG